MKRPLLAVFVLALFAAPAAAQTHIGSTRPAQDRPGLIAFGSYDMLNIASRQTFEAVFGTAKTHAVGAGLDVINVWRHVFVRVATSKASLDGERVAIVGSDVFKLGTKLTMNMTPTEVGAGWRFESRNTSLRLTPYVGASAVFLSYKETSTFADARENVSETLTGLAALGGVDIRLTRQVYAGAEAQYRLVNSSPSADSAAGHFNEKNLGGAVLRVKLGFRF